MERWIQAAKDHVHTIVDEIRTDHPEAEFETAFVGYRDYGDAQPFVITDFTSPGAMLDSIQDVHAEGGNDTAEDVAGGLQKVCNLEWDDEATMRVVIHIADAPAHGRQFHHPRLSDRFPLGDPDGLDPLGYLQQLVNRNIGYTFVKINDSTDVMLDAFARVYYGPDFKVLDLRPQEVFPEYTGLPPPPHDVGRMFSRAVSDSITMSLSRYSASQESAIE